MKRQRAAGDQKAAKVARLEHRYFVPCEIVLMIWSYMSLQWKIRARAVSRDWKQWIDDALEPALESEIAKLKAERDARSMYRLERAHEGFGPLKPWSEDKYRREAAFKLSYTHLLAPEFNTPAKARAAFRRLNYSEQFPSSAVMRLMSETKYGWKEKDYAWALAVACRRGAFDAARWICRMMHSSRRRIKVCVTAARNAAEAGCDDDTARLLAKHCSPAALEVLEERLRTLGKESIV